MISSDIESPKNQNQINRTNGKQKYNEFYFLLTIFRKLHHLSKIVLHEILFHEWNSFTCNWFQPASKTQLLSAGTS